MTPNLGTWNDVAAAIAIYVGLDGTAGELRVSDSLDNSGAVAALGAGLNMYGLPAAALVDDGQGGYGHRGEYGAGAEVIYAVVPA